MGLYETQEANYEYRKSMRESYNRGYEKAKAEYDAKLEEVKSRFKDCYYNKGYEQGKADARAEAIPVDWLMQKADWCDKNNGIFVSGAIRSAVDAWREEQNVRKSD